MNNDFRKKKILILLFLSCIFLKQNEIYASSGNTHVIELEKDENKKETKTESNTSKKVETELKEIKQDDDAQDKTSGNTKQENEKKVEENSNKIGTITENVGSDNHIYNGDKRHENRQFLTFKSKSGKEYYLIINYSKDGEQVQFLSDVSEEELLELVKEVKGGKISSERDNIKDTTEDKERLAKEIREELEKELNNKEKNGKVTKTKEQSLMDLVPYILIGGAVGYFYYNRRKKKREKENLEKIDDEEMLYDEEYIDEIDK